MKKNTRWINFLGGKNLIFTLVAFILVGVFFLVFRELEFIFQPIVLIASNILMPFVIALLLYYLLVPIIDFLERHKIKRVWGVALLYIVLAALLVGMVAVAIPALQDQVVGLVQAFPGFIESISGSVMSWIDNLPADDSFNRFIEAAENWLGQLPQNIANYLQSGFSGLSSVISSVTNVVVTIVTFPIILFFLLKDADRFSNAVLGITPPNWRTGLIRIATEVNNQVGSYIKGQLLVAVTNGVLMYIGFTLIGLNYNGVLAVAGGFLSIIPYLGPTLTFIPAVIVAIIDSWGTVFQLILVWLAVQFIEGNLVEPNVMGRQLNVHPLTIIIVLLVMGDLLGIFGLIFGIPIYAILKVIVVYWFQRFKEHYNKYYGDVEGEYVVHSIEDAVHDKGEKENVEEYVKKAEKEEEEESVGDEEKDYELRDREE